MTKNKYTPLDPYPSHGNFRNLANQRFGRLVALFPVGKKERNYTWLCRCDCGTETVVANGNLPSGRTQSCGCLNKEIVSETHSTHGMCTTPEYKAWKSMRERCGDPSHANWEYYGGRGISVCKRWRESFEAFFEDMGPRPSEKHSLDRIDNENGNYEPGNCRWASYRQQANNRRNNKNLTFQGETRTMRQWARETGINYHTLWSRLNDGWSVERALTEPVGGGESQ